MRKKNPCEIETASSVGLVNRRLGLMYIYIYIVYYDLYNGVFTIRIFIGYRHISGSAWVCASC